MAAPRYHPAGDQVAFANAIGKSLDALLPLSRLHASFEESSECWRALHELGVFGVSLPEAWGGSALGATEEALIALGLGRRVVAPAVLSTLGAMHLRTAEGEPPVKEGERVGVGYRRSARVGQGPARERIIAIQDAEAGLLLLRGASGAALFVRPAGPRLLDDGQWSSRLLELDALGDAVAQATPLQLLRLRLLDAAALAGLSQAALTMAVAYAGMREQFGRPIGSFQAIKHHCANMALSARCAADQVSFAAVAVDDGREDMELEVESALYVAASAALDNCSKNIQIHGGIGFSDEADAHHLLKRARVWIEIAGGLEASLERVGDYKKRAP